MNEIESLIFELAPQKRELLQLLLKEQSGQLSESFVFHSLDRAGPIPLTSAQQRLWFWEQFVQGGAAYNMPFAMRVRGQLQLPYILGAMNSVVHRHEILRTSFVDDDGVPVQIVMPWAKIVAPLISLDALPSEEREMAIHEVLVSEASHRFDLTSGQLIRLTLIKLDKDDHVILVNLHHIVADGWSCGILAAELVDGYDKLTKGESLHFQSLPCQYQDFSRWEKSRLQSAVLEKQRSYWLDKLNGAPKLLELGESKARPGVQRYRGAHFAFDVSAELSSSLRELSRQAGCTLFMTTLSIYNVLLMTYSGCRDLCVGTPVANRGRKEVQDLIGLFTNMLVLRCRLKGNPTFREFLNEVKENTLEALENQEFPFDNLIGELVDSRDMSHAPLFQVAFSFQNFNPSEPRSRPVDFEPFNFDNGFSKFDLTLNVVEMQGHLQATFEYDIDLFDERFIAKMASDWIRFAQAVSNHPDAKLSRLCELGVAEQSTLLEVGRGDEVEHSLDFSIHEMFEERAESFPEALALVDGTRSLSYRQLDSLANQAAHCLIRKGIGPRSIVAICLGRSIESIACSLAVLKTGAAYLPLDPTHPDDRLSFMLADSGSDLLITRSEIHSRFAKEQIRDCMVIDAEWHELMTSMPMHPPVAVSFPDGLAYAIYTSGSTGTPKAVMVTHGALSNLIQWHQAQYQVRQGDRSTHMAGVGFDASVWEIWSNLCSGASLFLVDDQTRISMDAMHDFLVRHAIDFCFMPTPLAQAFLSRYPEKAELKLKALSAGGDRLCLPNVAVGHGVDVVDLYGPSEYTVIATARRFAFGREEMPSIGRPIDNSSAYILDEFLNSTPRGVAGEIYLGGKGLSRGYLNHPALTADHFLPDPFSPTPGARMYRTGDRGRFLSDGNIQFLGRSDFQVSLRGLRIELGEIESVLVKHPAIRSGIVLLVGDQDHGSLIAYLVPAEEGMAPTTPELKEYLRQFLPAYMVPEVFICLGALPLTPNGKVDRRMLPAPEWQGNQGRAYEAPQNPIEEILAGLWRSILNVGGVGRHDSFFALGGHSLLATQLLSRMSEKFGVHLPIRALFDGPHLHEMAEAVARGLRIHDGSELPPIVRLDRTSASQTLSHAQQRLWFLQQMDPRSTTYNVPIAARLRGNLNTAVFLAALESVPRRHEILRTTFARSGDTPTQLIHEDPLAPCGLVDLSGLKGLAREAEINGLAKMEAHRIFDLEKGPLMRLFLAQVSETDHVLFACMHHIICDGWSAKLLQQEVVDTYLNLLKGSVASAPSPIQYADYAAWQRDWLATGIADSQLAHWKIKLGNAPGVFTLPARRTRPAVQKFEGSSVVIQIDRSVTSELKALSQRHGVTLFMVLVTGLDILLGKYTGLEDIVIGTDVANRNILQTEQLIGFFVNQLVLRLDTSGNPRLSELLTRVRNMTLDAYANQDLPFERIVAELQPERVRSHSPLFQIKIVYQDQDKQSVRVEGLDLSPVPQTVTSVELDLIVDLWESDGGLTGEIKYNSEVFEAHEIEQFSNCFSRILGSMSAGDDCHISELAYLPANGWKPLPALPVTIPANVSDICQLFDQRVAQDPEAIALRLADSAMTYGDLQLRANCIARYLMNLGAGPDVLIGVCMEASFDAMAVILGIMKAGAAYVPLDPSYPMDRLAFVLEDCSPLVIMTTEQWLGGMPATYIPIICLEHEQDAIDQQADDELLHAAHASNLAYVIYTSGSTGRPKGTLITRGNLLASTLARISHYESHPPPLYLLLSSLAFDSSVAGIFGTLGAGGVLHLLQGHANFDPHRIRERIRRDGITHYLTVAAAHAAIVEGSGDELASLSCVIVAGEACSHSVVALHESRLAHCRLFNEYGPTEATVWATVFEKSPGISGYFPIGKPIPGVDVHLLDRHLNPVPFGVPGELYIAGPGISRGYHLRPGLTASRFLPDPFTPNPGERIYRTGDLVRYGADGNIEFLGRIDQQLKWRGYRIEAGEIEPVLEGLDKVRAAAVVLGADQAGHVQLTAYVVAVEHASVSGSDMRAALSERLPAYMVPKVFVFLDELPLGPNGKLDRQALEKRVVEYQSKEYTAPATPLEQSLADVWSEVLNVENPGVTDNIFDLGADSIVVVQIVGKAKQLGIGITVEQCFSHQTIRELAQVVDTAPLARAEQGLVTGRVPLTPVQHWFLEQETPNPHHYNHAILLKSKSRVDPACLSQAINLLVSHHDALRIRWLKTDAGWSQVIGASSREDGRIIQCDLSALPDGSVSEQIAHLNSSIQRSLNIIEGPVIRVAYLDLDGKNDIRILIVIHHIAVDGVSWRILLSDLQMLYESIANGAEPFLPPKTTSFKEWSERLSDFARDDLRPERLGYWLEEDFVDARQIPHDYLAADNTDGSFCSCEVSLDKTATRRIVTLRARSQHASVQDVLISALARGYGEWSGKSRLILEMEGHGRENVLPEMDVSRTIGWFTSLYAVALDIKAKGSFGEDVQSISEQLARVPEKGFLYGVAKYLAEDDSETRKAFREIPDPCINFNYLGLLDGVLSQDAEFDLATESVGAMKDPRHVHRQLIFVTATVLNEQLRINFSYSRNLYRPSSIEKLASGMVEFLSKWAEDSASRNERSPHERFPLVAGVLSQSIADLALPWDEIEDIYTLSPMQQGMMFHAIASPGSGMYCEQVSCVLSGQLSIPAFTEAWHCVTQSHAVLRTSFLWKGLPEPLQMVVSHARLPIKLLDWQEVSPKMRDGHLADLMRLDRSEGFDLQAAPAMRLYIIQVSSSEHILLWSMHHIVLDGWSSARVIQEVFCHYQALCEGRRYKAPEVAPYRNYIEWLQQQDLVSAETYWRELFRNHAPAQLPRMAETIRGEGIAHQADTGVYEFHLSSELSAALRAFAKGLHVTLNTCIQAAWGLLLSRYSGSSDVVFGATTSGRSTASLAGVDAMVGLFINTLPLCLGVDKHNILSDWLKALQAQNVCNMRYDYTPLSSLHRWAGLPPRVPLFQSIIVFENYPINRALLRQNEAIAITDVRGFEKTNYPVTLVVTPAENIFFRTIYDPNIFDHDGMAEMHRHLEHLLRGMVRDGDQRLGSIDIFDANDDQAMRHAPGEARPYFDSISSIQEAFERQASKTPDGVAVFSASSALTYAELSRRSTQIAAYLRLKEIRPGDIVGVYLPRSPDLLATMLGILKAGAVILPLDPAYPSGRILHILNDANPKLVMVDDADRPLNGYLGQCAFIKQDAAIIESLDHRGFSHEPMVGGAPAYCMYTSGSTGIPKGVLGTHKAALNRFAWMYEAYPFSPDEVCCIKTSVNFVDSIWELFGPLLAGTRSVLIPDQILLDRPQLFELLRRESVTRISLVPSLLSAMLDFSKSNEIRLPALRICVVSGEMLAGDLAAQFHEQFPQARLLNLYGSSEVAADVTWLDTRTVDCPANADVPVGVPITDTRVYILDSDLRPVPNGVQGELYVGGAGLAMGYLNRPGLTAERFMPDPFGFSGPGELLYRTGDLACRRRDGCIVLKGRSDHQVKLRGIRIELPEIENTIKRYPGVRQCAAILRTQEDGQKLLMAYVVGLQNDPEKAQQGLRDFVRQELPSYLRPHGFIFLKALPVMPNGKTDRGALERLIPDEGPRNPQGRPPADSVERTVADIWMKILNVPSVSITENFFDLGGDSLSLMKAHDALRQAFDRSLEITDLFKYSSIESLSQHLKELDAGGGNHLATQDRGRLRREAARRREPRRNSTNGGVENRHE